MGVSSVFNNSVLPVPQRLHVFSYDLNKNELFAVTEFDCFDCIYSLVTKLIKFNLAEHLPHRYISCRGGDGQSDVASD